MIKTPVWRYREAVRLLTLRELRVRYSNSALGVIWSLLAPLAMTVVFSVIYGVLMPTTLPAYPVFFLAGLLPWNFFSLSLTATTQAITANSNLVKRVYFPREILPISVVLANGINFLIALVPLAVLMIVYGVAFTPALLWVGVILAIQVALSIGLGLGLSAFNTLFRDVQQVIDIFLLPLFFATPIFYTLDLVQQPLLRQAILLANPMASLVSAYRAAIYGGQAPDLGLLAITALEALGLLALGWALFHRMSDAFTDEL
ncbi:MAG TPA: ABC transporter permease [Anaerolineales bacterium]|nr:ABC transporter permease [Anaerolineales bacterium]